MRRREFLALSTGAALCPLGTSAWAAGGASGPKRLVVILLRGAVDGLNVVVPYGEEAYYAARSTIAIARPGAPEGAALPLDEHFALHPALAALMPLWEAKQLAFVHAAGSPDPSRSHFDAQLFLENGTPGRRGTADGWMNRLLAALPEPRGPTAAVAVGPTLPQILKGRMAVANLPLGPAAGNTLAVDRAWRQGRAARVELIAGLPAAEPADNAAPPPNGFPAQAQRLAGLLQRNHNIRLVTASLGGWDTHVRQGHHSGQLADRLRPLGDGLVALAQGLGPDWDDTVVVVMSEFGRTLRENGDGGTDHGHGNAVWLLGGAVRGGRVYGEWPGLAADALYEARDLAVTTDFRTVLAAVLGRHLRLSDRVLAQIFPDLPAGRSDLKQIMAA
jgi:uncharacterized protein (DUF1501 family)